MTPPPDRWLWPWPNGSVEELTQAVRTRVRDHLLELVALVEQRLDLSLAAAARPYRELDVGARVSPLFHALYWRLRQAIERSELDAVFDALRELADATPAALGDHRLRVESVLSERWERPIVQEYRAMSFGAEVEQARPRDGKVVVRPRLDDSPRIAERGVRQALDVLQRVDPALGHEVAHHLCRVKLFAGTCSPGGSTVKALGTIFMIPAEGRSRDPVVYYLDWLVHECGHMHLESLMMLVPLLVPDDATRFSSPLRPDGRTMHGVLHATFVLARLVRAFRATLASEDAAARALDREELELRLRRHEQHFLAALATVEQGAVLTEAGARWFAPVAALGRELAPHLDRPAPP